MTLSLLLSSHPHSLASLFLFSSFDSPPQVYLNKGYNTDGKAWSTPASVEGLEGLETDSSTTLYDAIVECRVIKTKKEIDIMQHITNLSSEAHFEVRVRVTDFGIRLPPSAWRRRVIEFF